MRVDLKIKAIVEQMHGISYEFNDWTRANVNFDNLPLPCCLNVLPPAGQLNFKNGNVRDRVYAQIAFLDKTDFDFEGEENEIIVEKMKKYAVQFVYLANESRLIKILPETINYSVVYDKLDVNVTGVVLSATIEEFQGVCIENFIEKC